MRKVELEFVTEVLNPLSGVTHVYPRLSEEDVAHCTKRGYITTHTEYEIQPVGEENPYA